MNFMTCTTCKTVVQVNATGTCLGCQMGFAGPQEDALPFTISPPIRNDGIIPVKEERELQRLEQRKQEIENALQKSATEEVSLCNSSEDCRGVRKRNSQGKKASKKKSIESS